MVRITLVETGAGKTTMKIEGRIVLDWIRVVETECHNLLTRGNLVSLDLSGVSFVGPEGVSMLRGLLDKGCVLSNCPLFIHHMLMNHTSC